MLQVENPNSGPHVCLTRQKHLNGAEKMVGVKQHL